MRDDDTLRAPSSAGEPRAAQPSGVEPTLAAGSASEVDATLAAGSSPPSGIEATLAPAITIRAGRTDDYRELQRIDRHHYVVGDEIARGGMGRILVARDRRLGRDVAIKELLVDSPDLRARFEREARITAKLQHPSIVNILEAGTWAGGEAFYVMKLVAGASLDQVIAARPTLDKRLELLPNVIAAVDALAYAHDHRVIHRDLKPANVLVGDYGETVVIDWGLAKDLADTSDAPEIAVGPYRSSGATPGATVAGAIMGTPAYMPIEQARGDFADERADVYSLGAMLYHVLAGEAPYTGKTADAILAQVIKDPVVPLDRRTPGVPPDLVTIVNKAMAKDAPDRYATAKQLAEDLKRFQTGQLVGAHRYSRGELVRRWVRRNKAAVAVATSFVGVLIVSSLLFVRGILSERDESERQRVAAFAARDEARTRGAETQRRRSAAETLVDQLVFDLKEKLTEIGKLDVLVSLAGSISTYYDALGDDETDPRALQRRSEALDTLGDVAVSQGKLEEAASRFSAAEKILQRLADSSSRHPNVLSQMTQILQKYGDLELSRGSTDKARVFYERANESARAHYALKPDDVKVRRNTAVAILKLGEVDERIGKYDEALRRYRETRETLHAIARLAPDDPARAFEVALLDRKISNILGFQGKLDEAGEALASAVAVDESVLAKQPDNASAMRAVAIDRITLAENLANRGQSRELARSAASAIAMFEQLAARDPTNQDRERDLQVAHGKVGELYAQLGDNAAAGDAFGKALAIAAKTFRASPTNRERRYDLAFAHINVARIDAALGRDRAERDFARAAELAAGVLAEDPAHAGALLTLGSAKVALGEIAFNRGDLAKAEAAYREALATHANTAGDDAVGQIELAQDHVRLGTVAEKRRDRKTARAEYEQAITMLEAAHAKWPTMTLGTANLAIARATLGTLSGDVIQLQRALELFEGLRATKSLSPLATTRLAETRATLARLTAARD
jgi:tetratricopeptide (TPR) repeat protein